MLFLQYSYLSKKKKKPLHLIEEGWAIYWHGLHVVVRNKGSRPYVKLQFRRLVTQVYAQESSPLKFSTELAPRKDQQNSRGAELGLLVAT